MNSTDDDVYSDAIEHEDAIDGQLYKSHSHESLRTTDSEVSTMSVWLEMTLGEGQPPSSIATSLSMNPHHHPLQGLTSPMSSAASHSSLQSTEDDKSINDEDIHGNSMSDNAVSEKEVAIKTKTKGKLGATFQNIHLVQSLRDAEFPIQGAIFSLCFSPDGHQIAAAGADRVIRIWSLLVKDALENTNSPPQQQTPHLPPLFSTDPILR